MSRHHSYLNSAAQIIGQYRCEIPFSWFLKKFFSGNKKFGSKDRKLISHMCYCYFRLGKAAMNLSGEERILMGLFLCSDESNDTLAALKLDWNEKSNLPLKEKLSITGFQLHPVFPWKEELSEGIDHQKFCESFFVQPDLFLRIRPGKEEIVKQKLQKAGIQFQTLADTCISLPNASKVDELVELDNEAVIQDLNSQNIGRFIKSAILNLQSEISVWDCCAGSGGKSIMAFDINPNSDLIVSDNRESIIANLKKRFIYAGIKKYRSFVTDLTKSHLPLAINHSLFDLIICDVPCTGSGTWSRTPEQLYFFEKESISQFFSLQKKIVSNTIPRLKAGGFFLYITCSVFKQENEKIADFIEKKFNLQKIKQEVLKGYDQKADTMFAALFQMPL